MNIISMIPARYQASRFPAKLLKDLSGEPVILRTYKAAVNTGLFNEVYVVTDSDIIYNIIKENGGEVIMSKEEHESGSDRIAEAVANVDVDVVVNVQGDEPFIDKESLEKLIQVFHQDAQKEIDLASLMTPIQDWEDISNPNTVKVVVDNRNFALYFSRSPIPYPRNKEATANYYKHKGVYAFRKRALMDFRKLPILALEAAEKIEAIRFLEYGKKIKMVETSVTGIEIDTPEDLERARKAWK
ncbi:MAG: 3-deoxy-manno-octulosonate cytidylyltransferase [Bacteroidota bacterium]